MDESQNFSTGKKVSLYAEIHYQQCHRILKSKKYQQGMENTKTPY